MATWKKTNTYTDDKHIYTYTYTLTETVTTVKFTVTKITHQAVSIKSGVGTISSYAAGNEIFQLYSNNQKLGELKVPHSAYEISTGQTKTIFSGSKTVTVNKTKYSGTVCYYTANNVICNFSAKTSYNITYNANGGSSPPATQKKWYAENIVLSSSKPNRDKYTFLNWNTKADGTGTTYTLGQTYTANAALTLYAQWAILPEIKGLTVVRCNELGIDDDEGTYAKVECNWIFNDTASLTFTGTITPQIGGSQANFSFDSGTTGTSGTAIALIGEHNGQYLDPDMQYTIEVSILVSAGRLTKRSTILTRAFFVMDWKAGGQAVGIGRAAPEHGLEIGYRSVFDDEILASKGIKLVDRTGTEYPGIFDNESNLWIGAPWTNAAHHVGGTYISSGYSGSDGNKSIYVSVPNADNTSATNYQVLHVGFEPINPSISITASTGVLDSYKVVQWGKIIQLWVRVRNTASVAKGGNLFVGTINTAALRPVSSISTAAHYAEYAFPAVLNTAGTITCRNANSTAFSTIPGSGSGVNLGFTYIVP